MKLTKIIVQILFLFQYNYSHKLSMVFGRAPAGRAIAASPPSLHAGFPLLSLTQFPLPFTFPISSFSILLHPTRFLKCPI